MHPQDSGAQTSQQPSPRATRRATPRTDSPSATQPASTRDAEQGELADLREQFPGFRIWREITGERVRFVARRARPGLNPHTIVTADIGELRAALHPSRNAGLVRFSPTTPSKIQIIEPTARAGSGTLRTPAGAMASDERSSAREGLAEPFCPDQSPTGPLPPTEGIARHLRTIAAELTAHGLTTHLTDSRAGLDLTATLSPSGKREAEIIIDEDGYAELRYWNPPDAQPAQVTATAIRALRAVTAAYELPKTEVAD